jgi:steroid 5-alpha reductase family enzyme
LLLTTKGYIMLPKSLAAIVVALVVVAVLVAVPFLLLWCIETIFPSAGVVYSGWQWLAALVVLTLFNSSHASK